MVQGGRGGRFLGHWLGGKPTINIYGARKHKTAHPRINRCTQHVPHAGNVRLTICNEARVNFEAVGHELEHRIAASDRGMNHLKVANVPDNYLSPETPQPLCLL